MWFLSELILLTILIYTNGYDRKCPHSSQWNFISRSYQCLGQQIYMCLLDNLQSNDTHPVYKPYCGDKDVSREGYRYIVTPNLYEVPCAASRYQPFTFTTDGNSQCVLSKSLCKGSGQILAKNGSSSTDTSCRCDYRQNFDYIIPPKDPCSCKPAEEDCSCYIRKCDDDKVMIADYRCMKNVETILPEDIKCPVIRRIIPQDETDAVDKKQCQPVLGSRTWSKQASVILVVVVIIFTVLIGFLFFSVPHVTIISLKSKFELSMQKDNEFMILNGDNVEIECNVRSYIPVRSVTWQKEIKGDIIQITPPEEKYEMNFWKRPSLTLINFNSDDEGKYQCVVKNVIGLRNKWFGSCMNYLSRVGWLTGFVTVLNHIPAFNTEDMTLHSYDIDSLSKATVYNVNQGDDITIEQCCDNQQKIKAIKWFKESDKRTELDISNEQYSGGVPDLPSLTIRITTMENAGKYLCLLVYDNGETQVALFKLKIIPQVKIYKAICEHRSDRTFIRPAICDTIDKHMQENFVVVITGREGTGKSKICLELASRYDEKDFMVFKVDLSENHTIYTDIGNALLIIDDESYTQDSLKTLMKHLLPVLYEKNIKIILTCRNLDLDIVKRVQEIKTLKDEAFIDINSCLIPEEKEEMLRRYMTMNNIATSSTFESNFRDPIILTDLSVQVKFDEDAIKIITNEEPWKGFPLSLLLFCSDRKCLHLGEKYFTNPPIYLVKELKEIYAVAKKTSNCIDTITDYCILVYIMNNYYHQIDINDQNIYRKLDELYHTLFHFKYIPEKHGSNEDQIIAIKKAFHRMNNKYLKLHEGMYHFIHPCLLKAMFLSSDFMVYYLLQNGSLQDITECVRSEDYTALENELVIKIDKQHHYILCERLVRHAFENHESLLKVADYIYTHWHSSGTMLVNVFFSQISFILFQSFGIYTDNLQQLDIEQNSTKAEIQVSLSNIIKLVERLTSQGKDPWIYGAGTADFLILSGLVTAAVDRYAANRNQTFDILLSEFQKRIHSGASIELLSKPLDRYGNTFFHYLMALSQKEASEIVYVIAKRKYALDTENVKKYTPLDIAAFLGKIDIFKVLNLKTSNCTNTLRIRFRRLAESGKAAYYKENSKNINLYQPMIHKTKDGSVSPEKLECEGGDNYKKEVIDENEKDKAVFKRKNSFRKEEHNKREEHDKKNVLCFEGFMIHIVDNEKIEDYQSIIKLFSKKKG